MTGSLTKPGKVCKAVVVTAGLLFAALASADKPLPRQDLRDCIASARGAQAIAACEKGHQAELEDRIKRWAKGIRKHLTGRELALFDRNVSAWKTFRDSELKMIDLTLQRRSDGLGPSLKPGVVTRIYEQRERQLREHLHNLSFAAGAPR